MGIRAMAACLANREGALHFGTVKWRYIEKKGGNPHEKSENIHEAVYRLRRGAGHAAE